MVRSHASDAAAALYTVGLESLKNACPASYSDN